MSGIPQEQITCSWPRVGFVPFWIRRGARFLSLLVPS
jgi:hypothetical protein